MPQLVLVAGSGRSGTSTMAGALSMLGHHLPTPVLEATEVNPRGFFESEWPVKFHRALLFRAVMEHTDGRPEAAALVARQADDRVRARLRDWLRGELARADRVVVKDPRVSWVPWLWAEEAARLGAATSFVTMLRHPAEVLASRSTAFRLSRPHMDDHAYATMNLAGWVNIALTAERQTREHCRAFVRYDDLRADWRAVMRRLRCELDLEVDHPLTDEPHPEVDAFIDPDLNRHQGCALADLGLPGELVRIAEDVHRHLDTLAGTHGRDPATEAALDDVGAAYTELYRRSQLIAVDAVTAHGRTMFRRGRRAGRRRAEEALALEPLLRRLARAARPRS